MSIPRSRIAIALCAIGMAGPYPMTAFAADDSTAAVIEDLKRRIDALEKQIKAQPAAPAAPAAVAAAPAVPAPVAVAKADEFKVTWGGFVKLDAIGSKFSDGAVIQGTGRDFYVPNSIPVAAVENGRSYTDFLAKETRLFLKGEGTVLGYKTGVYVEFDFISGQISQATGGSGNEAVTNAYNPSFRRGFITFGGWTLGQDWSTVQNLIALPDVIDFVAWPSEGTPFNRQPLIRYSHGPFTFALENPETTVHTRTTVAGGVTTQGSAGAASTDDNTVPDFIGKYTLKTRAYGDYTFAAIARQLSDRNSIGGGNDTSLGYGFSVAGKVPAFGKDDIRFTFSGGDGVGRYLALNSVGDAIVDLDGDLNSVEIYNGFIAYRHPWTEQWRSNLVLSAFHANTGDSGEGSIFGSGVTRTVRSVSFNLLYSPIPKLTLGGEFRHARRDTVGGLSGDLDRVQFSAKYAF